MRSPICARRHVPTVLPAGIITMVGDARHQRVRRALRVARGTPPAQRSPRCRRQAHEERRLDDDRRAGGADGRLAGVPAARSDGGPCRRGLHRPRVLEIAREASGVLADEIVLAEENIRSVVQSVPDVIGCEKIRTRGSADNVFVDLHLWLDGRTPLGEAHATLACRQGSVDGPLPRNRRRGHPYRTSARATPKSQTPSSKSQPLPHRAPGLLHACAWGHLISYTIRLAG